MRRGASSPLPQRQAQSPRAGTNLLKRGWQELKGGSSSRSAPAGGSRPSPWESGNGREGGGAGADRGRKDGLDGLGGGGVTPGHRLRLSCSTAQPGPRLAASPVPLRAELGPVNAAPAPYSRARTRAPENIPSLLPTLHPPPRQGPLRPAGETPRRRQGEESAALR